MIRLAGDLIFILLGGAEGATPADIGQESVEVIRRRTLSPNLTPETDLNYNWDTDAIETNISR